MSTDWNVYCVDCKDEHRFDDANHQDALMLYICNNAEAIAALDDLVQLDSSIELKTYYGRIDTSWFRKHLGHQLLPRSEYGDLLGSCPLYVTCQHCNYTAAKCSLTVNHDGPCAPKNPRAT